MKRKRSAERLPAYVLDTSALLAYLAAEPGSERIKELRALAGLPFVALTELYYVTWRKQNQSLAEEVIQNVLGWNVPLLLPDQRLSLLAGSLKARYHLGFADSFIAAFALAHRAVLVTKDSDFYPLKSELQILAL